MRHPIRRVGMRWDVIVSYWRKQFAILILGLSCLAGTVHATPFNNVVLFGDSLSDTGNVSALTSTVLGFPFPSYIGALGRFSNGPNWVDHLAIGLGVPALAQPANLLSIGTSVISIGFSGGTNYAFGGARTGLSGSAGSTTGLLGQLRNWNGGVLGGSLERAADPDALYILMLGANDLRDARTAYPSLTAADADLRAAAAAQTAENILNAASLLADAGARHVLLSTVPDLGGTPEAVALGVAPASTDVTLRFNAELSAAAVNFDASFAALTGIDLDIRILDFAGLANEIFVDATTNGGALFGITNIATPCIEPFLDQYFIPGAKDANGNCPISAFSDPLHPSARFHELLAREALATLTAQQSVPEPSTGMLLVAGLIAATAVCIGRSF